MATKPAAAKAKAVEVADETVEDAVTENDGGVSFDQDEELGEAIDLSGFEEDKGFEVIPRGNYPVVVDEAEFTISSKGNQMISLTLVIEEGDFANRKLFTHVVFAEKTMGRAKKMIRVLGLTELLETKFKPADVADQFVGCRAKARVGIRLYEGEQRNEVKQLLPAGEAGSAFQGV